MTFAGSTKNNKRGGIDNMIMEEDASREDSSMNLGNTGAGRRLMTGHFQ